LKSYRKDEFNFYSRIYKKNTPLFWIELVLRKIKNRGIIYAVLFLIPWIAVITADGEL